MLFPLSHFPPSIRVNSHSRVVSDYDEYRQQKSGSFSFADEQEDKFNANVPFLTLITNYERKVAERKSNSKESQFKKEINFFKVRNKEVHTHATFRHPSRN